MLRQQETAGHRAGEGLPSSRRHYLNVPRPIRRGVPDGCASRLFTASVAFTVISAARLPLLPPSRAGPLTTLQASHNAADHPVAPPYRASDAGLRRRAFPPDAASLLPGLLAATRTGLPPASDDELTNTKIHHGATSRCHLLLCWAHERPRLASEGVSVAAPAVLAIGGWGRLSCGCAVRVRSARTPGPERHGHETSWMTF
jgi:hypothetical protein